MNSTPAFTLPCTLCRLRLTSFRPAASSRSSRRLRVRPTPCRLPIIQAAGGPPPGSSDPPGGPIITKALEVTFRNVWIRLMTAGVGPEYDDAIQAFVIACIAAYKAGYSLTAIKLELAANETQAKYMGRDISLNDQEKETRLIWLALVYLTLAKFNFASDRTPPPVSADLQGSKMDSLVPGLTGLVESVCDAAAKGYSLQTFKMELSLKKNTGDKPLSGAEASIRSQWSRIIFATYKLLPENLRGKPNQR